VLRIAEGQLHRRCPLRLCDCRRIKGSCSEFPKHRLLDGYLAELGVRDLLLWYYTPMSQSFSAHLPARTIIYDCMDELSAFRGAPPELVQRERELLQRADVVFTGGYSIWEAKRALHTNAHAFPSSVDVAHFAAARTPQQEPDDQRGIARPRLGFYGVIDERFDIDLLREIAAQRPQWQFVMIGPVVKIDASELPQADNIHYLGGKTYDELPGYLSGWDVALMPFAMNASTRFISPTKTPEYLAGGCPVVSTPIHDVVRTYGDTGVVRIADTADAFVAACEAALQDSADREQLLDSADAVLGDMSWDHTYDLMKETLSWKQ
ncbi:glycosyltransferase family 1 protein, partial [Xanthomonas vasicola]